MARSMRLVGLAWAVLGLAGLAGAENIVFPADAGVVNVKDTYGAKGDGVTDDTAALQKAIDENKGKPGTLYFPNGVYLVSNTLDVGGEPHSKDRFLVFQGQSEEGTVLKLQDKCPGYGDSAKPKIVLSLYDAGRFSKKGTGDAMHGYVRNLTVDVGVGNPGAVALRFMANNTGGVYHVTVRSSDPARAGKLGLDMRQGQNGPNLVKHVTVIGFDTGVDTGDTFSLVFEHLTLKEQKVLGFRNTGRTTIRRLTSVNRVPVLRNIQGGGYVTLIEGDFTGGDAQEAAIISANNKMFLRDLKQQGYGHMVKTTAGAFVDGAVLDEWHESKANTLFDCEARSLRLPIKETPEIPWEEDLSKWAKVDGAGEDDTQALQAAIDQAAAEGKTTIYFARGGGVKYTLSGPIRVHGSVNRIIGLETIVDVADPSGTFKEGKAVFTFENLKSDAIAIERFFLLGGWKAPDYVTLFENKSGKAVVIRNLGIRGTTKKPCPGGEWFFEDVAPGRTSTLAIAAGEKVWARQFNPETPKVEMMTVDGGQLWILGLKTEGRSSHLTARNGAKVEILGGVSYQSWGNQELDPPMFTVIDSDVAVSLGFYHYKTPFTTIASQTQGKETRTLARKELSHYHLNLFRACSTPARSGQ